MRRFEEPTPAPGDRPVSWPMLMEHWELVELDFQEVYGIDLSTPGLLQARSFRWLVRRGLGLLSTDRGPFGTGGSRVQRVLRPVKFETPPTPGATP